MRGTIGLYRPGTSVVHRLPAEVKLGGLVAAGVGAVFVRTPAVAGAALVAVALGYAAARLPARVLASAIAPLLWVVVPLTVLQVVVAGWERATVTVGVLVALVLLANLVTLTTRTTALVDVVVRVAGRLRFLGVNPERLGLMLNLAIRAVPLVAELSGQVREAQIARGHRVSARAFAVPLVVGALRRADQLGEALVARGVDD